MRGLSVKNAVLLWKSLEVHENSSFESENKEGYIHGLQKTVKVKHRESRISDILYMKSIWLQLILMVVFEWSL
jgi:hypothetical protein